MDVTTSADARGWQGADRVKRVSDQTPTPDDDLPEQVRVRREKYDRLVAAGTPPYTLGYPRTTSIAAVRDEHDGLETDTASGSRGGSC